MGPGVAEGPLFLRRAGYGLARLCASRGACWPVLECFTRNQLPDRGEVGARGGRTLEPPGGKRSTPVHTPYPSPAREVLEGRATVTSFRKNARTEGKRATQDEKTPPIFINAQEPRYFKKPTNKYKKEAKANGRIRRVSRKKEM